MLTLSVSKIILKRNINNRRDDRMQSAFKIVQKFFRDPTRKNETEIAFGAGGDLVSWPYRPSFWLVRVILMGKAQKGTLGVCGLLTFHRETLFRLPYLR